MHEGLLFNFKSSVFLQYQEKLSYVLLMRVSCFSITKLRLREGKVDLSQWRGLGLDFTKAKGGVGGSENAHQSVGIYEENAKQFFNEKKKTLPQSLTNI